MRVIMIKVYKFNEAKEKVLNHFRNGLRQRWRQDELL